MEEKGPWVMEGNVKEVCARYHCFVVLWRKLYGLHRTSRRQHMRISWESTQLNPELGIKLAAEARKCQGRGLPEVAVGLTWGGAPCRVWPKKEEDTVARAAAKRDREIIMFTDRETGIATVRQRGADPMAGRSGKEASNVYGGAGRT